MSVKIASVVCAVAMSLVLCVFVPSRAQETPIAGEKTTMSVEPQWLWGEVETVNAQAKTIQVKYLDYDTDIEKELVLTVDAKTKFENAKGLEDIKTQDTVSVDYFTGSDGVNLAVAVSLEKLEDMEAAPEDLTEPALERVGSEPVAAPEQQAAPSEAKE
jgi:hypothetical protein